MNTIKATVKIAGFLIVVLLALGCGPMRPPSANTNQPAQPAPTLNHVVNSMEHRVRGFAIDADKAPTAAGSAVAADDAPIYEAATPDGKFLYVANAGTEAIGISSYRIDGLRGSLMPAAPAEFATTRNAAPFGIGSKRRRTK